MCVRIEHHATIISHGTQRPIPRPILGIDGIFSDVTDVYARHRPTYPREAIEAIIDGLPDDPLIADVGCGTGIASRQLAAVGARVIGIEPNESMRTAAKAAAGQSDRMQFQDGVAEATGLAEASVDAVVCAQAFHWFDEQSALAEFARVLRPGGRLALVWNRFSSDEAFSAAFRAVMNEAGRLAEQHGRVLRQNDGTGVFRSPHMTDAVERTLSHSQTFDLDGVLGRARSASYFPTAGPANERLERALRRHFDEHARGDPRTVVLHYSTRLIVARRT